MVLAAATVGALASIGLWRVFVVGGRVIRRLLARAGRALARLDVDAWIGQVATDATVIEARPRGRKVRS